MGKLIIKVICGRNLKGSDMFSAADGYIKLSIGNKQMRTKAINDEANPNWNESFSFHVPESAIDTLKMELWDANTFKDDLVATASVPLTDLVKDARIVKVVSLSEGKGQIHIELLADFGVAAAPQMVAPLPYQQQQQQQQTVYGSMPSQQFQPQQQQQQTLQMTGVGGAYLPQQQQRQLPTAGYQNPYGFQPQQQQQSPQQGFYQQQQQQGSPMMPQQQQQPGGYPTAASYAGGNYQNPYASAGGNNNNNVGAGYQNPYASQYPAGNGNGLMAATGACYGYPGYPQQQQQQRPAQGPAVGGLGFMPTYY